MKKTVANYFKIKEPIEGWESDIIYKCLFIDVTIAENITNDNIVNEFDKDNEELDDDDFDVYEKRLEESKIVQKAYVLCLLANHITGDTGWFDIKDLEFVS